MKRILPLIIAFVSLSVAVSAQSIKTSYFMPGAISRTEMNAALAPERGYINLPVISGTSVGFSSSALAVEDLLFPSSNGLVTFLDSSINRTDFLKTVNNANAFNLDFRTNLFGFGWYTKNSSFWSFDMSLRTELGINIPGDLFNLLVKGSGNYSFANLGVDVHVFQQTTLGYSRMINDKLRVGANFKLLAGIASAEFYFEELDLNLVGSEWSVDAQGSLVASLSGIEMDYTSDGYLDLGTLNVSPTGVSGWGAAIDLGATYEIIDNLTLSLAVNDLGYINYSSENTIKGVSEGSFTFNGIDLQDTSGDIDLGTLENLANFKQTSYDSNKRWLNATLNAGVEYAPFNNKINLGLLSSSTFYGSYSTTEFTSSLGLNPCKWLSLYGSYTIMNSGKQSFGAAINYHPCWINFFIGTDYIISDVTPQYVPISQTDFNINFGISFTLARNPSIKREYKDRKDTRKVNKYTKQITKAEGKEEVDDKRIDKLYVKADKYQERIDERLIEDYEKIDEKAEKVKAKHDKKVASLEEKKPEKAQKLKEKYEAEEQEYAENKAQLKQRIDAREARRAKAAAAKAAAKMAKHPERALKEQAKIEKQEQEAAERLRAAEQKMAQKKADEKAKEEAKAKAAAEKKAAAEAKAAAKQAAE